MESYSLQMPEWLAFLLVVCALAEGDAELVVRASREPNAAAEACVVTALGDSQHRVAVIGGREGMPRSLGSVFGGSVTRFLGGFRGGVFRAFATPRLRPYFNSAGVTCDGSALLVSDYDGGSHAIHVFSVHTGALLRTVGGPGCGPLQFSNPCQVWVASDGFVFVADCFNDRIQVLTPRYDFHAFLCVGHVRNPQGVCANDDVIVISERCSRHITVFGRSTGSFIRRFGCYVLHSARGLCFTSRYHVAVADTAKAGCVTVFTLEGNFVRHVGDGKLRLAGSIACSSAGELVVADHGNERVVVYSASGEIVWTSTAGSFVGVTGVAIFGSTIYGQSWNRETCFVVS